jgi:hypothetical protein
MFFSTNDGKQCFFSTNDAMILRRRIYFFCNLEWIKQLGNFVKKKKISAHVSRRAFMAGGRLLMTPCSLVKLT